MTENFTIKRLTSVDAEDIADCVFRVYGDSYAHEVFYDIEGLSHALRAGTLNSVGAYNEAGKLMGHMAMSLRGSGTMPELGNTLVDPEARGSGLAWEIGKELTTWCRELGHYGFLHYPTTEHHIMQRQAAKQGFETGLMLGYIPTAPRSAATVVFEPFDGVESAEQDIWVPGEYCELIAELANECGLRRCISASETSASSAQSSNASGGHDGYKQVVYQKRGLARLTVDEYGNDLDQAIESLVATHLPCLQIDLLMNAPNIAKNTTQAKGFGFSFCGWLPGFLGVDVLRLQRCATDQTDFSPELVNPRAKAMLASFWCEKGID